MQTPPKPKWMRWKTYSRITQQIEASKGSKKQLDVVFISRTQRILTRLERAEHAEQEATVDAGSAAAEIVAGGDYGETRFNALRHGILSRYTVLPWEDQADYQALLAAFIAEHAPVGATEEHLVEELAGIVWRKRRLRLAEAAVYREKLRRSSSDHIGPNHVASAALLPLTGDSESNASIPRAIAAAAADTARDLREATRDQGMSQRALNILEAGGPDAYETALDALRDDTREYWQDCLSEPPDDGLTYTATPEALKTWIEHHWQEWYDQPIVELQHRDAIREQALGIAYAADGLEAPARYEIHLDRKLERILAMLIKLRELRQPTVA
jgi:hypothetical protein